jgi:hypothetical protein
VALVRPREPDALFWRQKLRDMEGQSQVRQRWHNVGKVTIEQALFRDPGTRRLRLLRLSGNR